MSQEVRNATLTAQRVDRWVEIQHRILEGVTNLLESEPIPSRETVAKVQALINIARTMNTRDSTDTTETA